MVNRPEKGRDYYQCRKPPLGRGCGALVSGRQLDQLVTDRIFAALDSPEFTQALKAPRQDQGLAAQLERDENKLAWLGHEYAADRLPEPAFLTASRDLAERIKTSRARLARQHRNAALSALPETLDQLREAWQGWDVNRRRALVETLILKVVVEPSVLGSRTGRRFDRSRARITWRV